MLSFLFLLQNLVNRNNISSIAKEDTIALPLLHRLTYSVLLAIEFTRFLTAE